MRWQSTLMHAGCIKIGCALLHWGFESVSLTHSYKYTYMRAYIYMYKTNCDKSKRIDFSFVLCTLCCEWYIEVYIRKIIQ